MLPLNRKSFFSNYFPERKKKMDTKKFIKSKTDFAAFGTNCWKSFCNNNIELLQ